MSTESTVDILILGDVIGRPGRRALLAYLDRLSPRPHLIIANVENIAHGFGVGEKNLEELSKAGVGVFTGGNHTFDRKEIFDFIDRWDNFVRPANYPQGTPGKGHCIVDCDGLRVAIINLMGRVFMEPLQSPFTVADTILDEIKGKADIVIVDIHAEATSEKVAMGWYLDGRASIVVGTHTHVQTADERLLPGGTAYLTDMGCCGPADGIIGMDRKGVFRRLIQQLPTRFEVAEGPAMVNGVRVSVDRTSGKAVAIARVREVESESGEGQADE